jgi:2-keto-4-pentenoate hydratase/2-oxohepta-3-ene-1,7-dioic acid hydratase in catechol pathway
LTVVIGKELKDLGENEDPTPYILGYTVGNDVSSRYWQRPERNGGQHWYAKSFDKFAPIGPILASTAAIPDPTTLKLETRVNGEKRQSTGTDDMIHGIPAILRFLSRGTTLKPGTIIMTGTPGGVAAFMKPPAWLQDGDIVEIEISGLGTITNKMVLAN